MIIRIVDETDQFSGRKKQTYGKIFKYRVEYEFLSCLPISVHWPLNWESYYTMNIFRRIQLD